MTKIVIDRPPSPLPPLSAPARKWVPRAEWAKRAAEGAAAASLDDPEEFDRVIRNHLFWARVR